MTFMTVLIVTVISIICMMQVTSNHPHYQHVCYCLIPKHFPSPQAKELPTFKDNDFLNEGQKLQIGDDNKKYFLEKLKRDVEVRNTSGF